MVGSTLVNRRRRERLDKGKRRKGSVSQRLRYCAFVQVLVTIIESTEFGWEVVFEAKKLSPKVSNRKARGKGQRRCYRYADPCDL